MTTGCPPPAVDLKNDQQVESGFKHVPPFKTHVAPAGKVVYGPPMPPAPPVVQGESVGAMLLKPLGMGRRALLRRAQ